MEEQDEIKSPSSGKSMAFAIGFIVAYAVLLFIVLEVFFSVPF